MKREKIIERIKFHKENKKYTRISRRISKDQTVFSHGYILDYSDDLILLRVTDDFMLDGYNVLPIKQIEKLRYNKWDKYYDKILQWEGEKDKVGIDYAIDLKNWKTVFKSIKETNFNVIVECEDPAINSFTIGSIEKIGKKKVAIMYFDPAGYFDDKATSIDYLSISKVQFNDRYTDVFSKYTRHRKKDRTVAKMIIED